MEVRVKVKTGSTSLGDKGQRILKGALQGLWLNAQKYPETLGVSMALDGVLLTSVDIVLATSGIKQDHRDSGNGLISGEAKIKD